MTHDVHIIGGGLAGSEAAWQLAQAGLKVHLSEMRGSGEMTPAHQTDSLAELVCSNSFRSDDSDKNAVGLLHDEMRRLDSIVMSAGEKARVPAGSAMAVDRDVFSAEVERRLAEHPNVIVVRERVDTLPDAGLTIVATGPLTAQNLAQSIVQATGEDRLAFFDAIAPIVHRDSIDMSKCWIQSRWNKRTEASNEDGDYINCPMTKEQYETFVQALIDGEKTEFKEWEADTPYFDGCMPIEVMAERGRETLRFGPMKPVGLTNPHDPDTKPYAVVQLRRDNKLGTLYNIVGFQTKMKYGAQTEVLRMIPGLENASFARLGGIHRNTFLNSPTLLDDQMRLRSQPNVRFAGQITGVEGYVESAAMGLLAGRLAVAEIKGEAATPPPPTTATGALITHITGGADAKTFQPMNVNFGLFPPVEGLKSGRRGRKDRYKAYTDRAKTDWQGWLDGATPAA